MIQRISATTSCFFLPLLYGGGAERDRGSRPLCARWNRTGSNDAKRFWWARLLYIAAVRQRYVNCRSRHISVGVLVLEGQTIAQIHLQHLLQPFSFREKPQVVREVSGRKTREAQRGFGGRIITH